MKKRGLPIFRSMLFRTVILLLWGMTIAPTSLCHAQADGNGYGPWKALMGHIGIDYRLKCTDCDELNASHTWWVEFRNNTGQRVSFDFHIDDAGRSNIRFSDGVVIDPGGTKEGWNQVNGSVSELTMTVYTDHWKSGPGA